MRSSAVTREYHISSLARAGPKKLRGADARSKLPTDPQNREQATESSKPSLSPEMASLVAGLREEAEYSEHYGGLVYVNNNNLILLLDALEGKSHE